MAWSGSGAFSLTTTGTPFVAGTTISSTVVNNLDNEIATGINACLAKNGENSATANLPMGGFKHTGAADANATGQYLVYGQSGTSLTGMIQQGVHTLPINASAMISRTTNGAGDSVVETTTNKVMIRTKDFDQTTQEYVQFYVPMPKSWDEGTLTVQFLWTAASGSGTVTWGIQGLARSDDDALDTAFGTAQTVTDTLITANDVHITSFTSAITCGGTPAESDMVIFQLYRDVADTLTADAKLLSIRLNLTINANNDA